MISDKMLYHVKNGSTIRKMFDEGRELKKIYGDDNVYDFSIGNPATNVPAQLLNTIHDIILNTNHSYMDNAGYYEVRKNIVNEYNSRYNTNLNPLNMIMTVGAAGGLNIILKTLLNKDDEVIVFSPFFGEYTFYIDNHGGKLVICETDNNFMPNIDDFRSKITDKTKAVIINTPNNPTGVVYSEKLLIDIADILKNANHTIYLISDEPYREIIYTANKSYVPITNIYDNSIICYSYSKSLAIPGERVGYVLFSEKIYDVENLRIGLKTANRILGFVNAPSLFQKAIGLNPDLLTDIELYKKNMKVLKEILDEIGYEYIEPEGAFYLFLKSLEEDDIVFCDNAKKYNLLIVPSSSFGCKGYARISYCVNNDTIVKSKESFIQLWRYYNDNNRKN